jgi:hypothetical protein
VVKISPEGVTVPEQGKSSGRIVTFSLWTGVFRDGISSILVETVNTAVTRSSFPRLWEQGIALVGEDDCCVGEALLLRITTAYTPLNYLRIKIQRNNKLYAICGPSLSLFLHRCQAVNL